MRKWLIGLLCIGVLAGWILYSRHGDGPDSHMEFPFEASEIEGMTLYCVGAYYPARDIPNVLSQSDHIDVSDTRRGARDIGEYYYKRFKTAELKKISQKEAQELEAKYFGYGPYAEVAFRFDLVDGKSYEVVFTAYGIQSGVFRLPDGTFYISMGDFAGVWTNLYERMGEPL